MDNSPDTQLARLRRSSFRAGFRLAGKEAGYCTQKGLDTIREHAVRFVRERLAPSHPRNDGRQTPLRNHPVFIAQHATATCCRGCLEKWYGIPRGRALTGNEQEMIVEVIMAWIANQSRQANTGQEE